MPPDDILGTHRAVGMSRPCIDSPDLGQIGIA